MGEPEVGDTHKFATGIKDLVDSKYDIFNRKIQNKQGEFDEALNDYEVKIRLVLAYTGSDSFSSHNQKVIDDLLNDLNDGSDIARFERFTLRQAHQALVSLNNNQPINTDIDIENWGLVETPYRALYGTVNGTFLAELWSHYHRQLFSENIRGFLGKSSVNEDIIDTIKESPDDFFYYNNGVTVLCQNFRKSPKQANRTTGRFAITDFKIVNGAQTVGSLGEASLTCPDKIGHVSVLIKIISLEDVPSEFGSQVTRKTNTQNKIEKRDFVSLDPEQERIKTELALEGIDYRVRRSDDNASSNSCTVEEVLASLACLQSNIDYSVIAKREVGKLWEDIKSEPYTLIINSNLKAITAWRCVITMRTLASYISVNQSKNTGRKRSCLIHSNRFVLHELLTNMPKNILFDEKYDFNGYISNNSEHLISDLEEKVYRNLESNYSQSLVHQVFRNFTKCRVLDTKMNDIN